jgi:hypothetical protein
MTHEEEIFETMTKRLMLAKYCYYVKNHGLMYDWAYDFLEKEWYTLGRKLGKLGEHETSPCVDFDQNHPLAKYAEQVYEELNYSVYASKY